MHAYLFISMLMNCLVPPGFLSAGQLRAPAGRELVLDYIIERKRMDDLCGSIIDGRFREQKVGAHSASLLNTLVIYFSKLIII